MLRNLFPLRGGKQEKQTWKCKIYLTFLKMRDSRDIFV